MFCSIRSEISIGRLCLGLSTVEFSRIVKMSQASVSAWERYVRPVPRDAISHYLSFISPAYEEITIETYCRAAAMDDMLVSVFTFFDSFDLRFVLACAFEIRYLLERFPLFAHAPRGTDIALPPNKRVKLLAYFNHILPKTYERLLDNISISVEDLTFFSWFLNKIINRVSIRFEDHFFTPKSLQDFCTGIFETIKKPDHSTFFIKKKDDIDYNNYESIINGIQRSLDCEVADKEMIADLFHLCFNHFIFSEQNYDELPDEKLIVFPSSPGLSLVGVSGNVYHLGYGWKPFPPFRWETRESENE